MKNNKIQKIFKQGLFALGLGAITLTSVTALAVPHELVYGIGASPDNGDQIISFYADTPGTIESSFAVQGLAANEQLRGLDYHNGVLYGYGSFGRLYSVDGSTGMSTQIGTSFGTINGAAFGVDNEPGGLRITSDLDRNVLIDRATGSLISNTPLFSPTSLAITALAYGGGTLYGIDSATSTFGTVDTATGSFLAIGPLGISASRISGLDISVASGVAYLGTPASSGDPQANLYTINLLTGFATLNGLVGLPGDDILIRGLTAVPEPGTVTLFALGGLGALVFSLRRRK